MSDSRRLASRKVLHQEHQGASHPPPPMGFRGTGREKGGRYFIPIGFPNAGHVKPEVGPL